MKSRVIAPPIVIAGAGIAGLSAAIALKLAGFAVQVFEREIALTPIGAGIQLGPNATRILTGWTVPLRAFEFQPESLQLRNGRSGHLLNTIPLGQTAVSRYGAPYVTMLRSDLQTALLARARALECPITFGCPVIAVSEDEEGLTIGTGTHTLHAAALIGADGLWSSVRRCLSYSPEPAYTHTNVWRSILPADAVPPSFRKSITLWMASGAHLVHYPISHGQSLNAVLAIDEDWRTNTLGTKETAPFLPCLQRWAEVPLAAIEANKEWQHWPLHYLPRSPGGNRYIQLVGDAWHAMPPFLASGAALAVEDAASLAASLLEGPDAATALSRFRKMRASRVWRVASQSSRMGRIYHFPRPFDGIRDVILRNSPAQALLAGNDWLYGKKS